MCAIATVGVDWQGGPIQAIPLIAMAIITTHGSFKQHASDRLPARKGKGSVPLVALR